MLFQDYVNLPPSDTSNEVLIDFTQQARLALLTEQSDDPKLALAILKGISDTALSSKRISTEENTAAADREVAFAINESLKNIQRNPFLSTTPMMGQIPLKAPEIELITPLYGEMDDGEVSLNITDIIES
jgi:hypothetical protein